jgi:hypothetical protein
MDSIVIMEEKCVLFITILTELEGNIKGKKHEETKP